MLNKSNNKYQEFVSNPWKVGIVAIMFYLAFQVFADILAIKQTTLFGLVISPAFVVFPMTFTLRDVMHKYIGKQGARLVIVTALALNAIMLLIFQLYVKLPAVAGTEDVQAAVSLIFGSMWRIVLASILAEFASEMMDTEVYQAWVNKFGERHQWGRVLFSNLVAGPIDIVVFKLVAFAGWLPMSVVWANIGGEMLLRVILAVVTVPLIYLAPTPTTNQLANIFIRGYKEKQEEAAESIEV
jgi:queuosine precursor transporter